MYKKTIKLANVEYAELSVLNQITNIIRYKFDFILERLTSRFETYSTWKNYLIKKGKKPKRLSDLGTGAERIFNYVFVTCMKDKWHPVSIPFGSNLFFESNEAFINIDVKTEYADNTRDYKGLVVVGDFQTSYRSQKYRQGLVPKLKPFYRVHGKIKYCLTYAIQVIVAKPEDIFTKKYNRNPVSINIICIPNGLLYEVYHEEIVGQPKSYYSDNTMKGFRYLYWKEPRFKLLKNVECPYRIRLFFNKEYENVNYRGIVLSPSSITNIRRLPQCCLYLF